MPEKSKIFHDQMNTRITMPWPPQRIISLVPSQTEFLFDLGLEAKIVGVTQFCEHPCKKTQLKTKIGGTKRFNFKIIDSLKPDLIIGNKEENYREGIEQLQQKYPVWMSDIRNLTDAIVMMEKLGEITDKSYEAAQQIAKIKQRFMRLATETAGSRKPSVAYFIWRKPYMVAGSDTFIDVMLNLAGFNNVFSHLSRYPSINAAALSRASPDCILLSSEPYPFQALHLHEFQSLCPQARIIIVNGQVFSWYGSRLRYSADYFRRLRRVLWRSSSPAPASRGRPLPQGER